MVGTIRRFLARRREKRRQQLLALIGRDIERIATDAYREGCYITNKRMRAERLVELQHLMSENDHLRKMMIDRANLTIPDIILEAEAP